MWEAAVFMAAAAVLVGTTAAFVVLWEMLRHVRHERRMERDRARRIGGES